MIIQYLNTLTAVIAILSAGYIFARIHIRMRALAAGSLLAYGMLKLHSPLDGLEAIHLITSISIICCLVHFAIIANNFVELATNIVKVKTDRHPKEPQPITDFPPHNYVAKDESNVTKR